MNSLFYSTLMSSSSIKIKKKLNIFYKLSLNYSNSHYRYLYLNCIIKKNSKIMSLNNLIIIICLIVVNLILSSNCVTSNKIRSKQIFNKTNEFHNYNSNNKDILNNSYSSNDDDIKFITKISSQSSYNNEPSSSFNKMLEFNLNSKFDNNNNNINNKNNYNNNNNNNNNYNNNNMEIRDQIQQQQENDNHEDIDTYNRELFDQLTTSNPCLVHYCQKGRECILDTETNQPKCICLRYCSHRKRPICGSNGQIYENHCELHRASCIQSTPITYQRMENCFQLNNNNMDDNIQLNDEISNDFEIFKKNLNYNATSSSPSFPIIQQQVEIRDVYNYNDNKKDNNNDDNSNDSNNNDNDRNYDDNNIKNKPNKSKLYSSLHKTKKISTSSIPLQHEQQSQQQQQSHSLQEANSKQIKVIKSKMKKCPSKLNYRNNNNDKNSNNNNSNNSNNNDCLNGYYINHNNHNHNHNHNHHHNINNNNKNNNDGIGNNINTESITESNHETIVIYQETTSYSGPTATNYNKILKSTVTTITPLIQKPINITNKNITIPKSKYLTDLLKNSNIKYNASSFNTINNINQQQKQQRHINENITKNIQKSSFNYLENININENQSQQKQQEQEYQQKINQHKMQQQQTHNTSILNNNKNYYCTSQEYEIMKDNLLLYSHARLMSQDNNHSKDFLVSVMFSHYDQNNDAHLEYEELNQITIDEHLDELSVGCVLTDMLNFDDNNQDGKLSINEFYQAFSKLYSVSVVSLDKALETNHLSARVGDNVEIKCDVTGTPTPPLIWRRNGIELSSLNEDEIRVYSDGSLYLTRIQLYHSGNYSCHAQRNKDIVQTHVLSVYTVPQVRVTPRIQSKRPGENAEMFCHVIGDPFPKVEWLKNDESLNFNIPDKYKLIGNGTALHISNIAYSDTGAYMCQASNVGIAVRDISSLIVQEEPAPTVVNEERKFFAFYDYGIAVYEPSSCRLYHQIQGDDTIPGTQEYVCGSTTTKCSWGRSINVGTRYIYATQPTLNRIIVISTIQMVVIEVLLTDKYPVELFYVPRLDQVWILCWKLDSLTRTTTTTTSSSTTIENNEISSEMMKMMLKMMINKTKNNENNEEILKTIQVIRDADKKRKHHVVHPEPIDGQFDLIKNLFLPSNDLEQPHYSYNYGYVTHKNQRGLYKLDLQNLRYTKSVDLTLYNCVPEKVEFSALYGFVIMSCREPVTNRPQGQIVLDYLTDAILTTKPSLIGLPKISPDSRHLVTVQHYSDGVVIIVQKIKATGLEFLFDVRTTLNISDLTFYESQSMHGYDLFASAADKEDILYLNLFTGKVEMITGVGTSIPSDVIEWGNSVRTIKSSGLFGQYMATPSETAIFIINGRSRTINCEIGGILYSTNIVWSHNIPSSSSLTSSPTSSSSALLSFTGNENTFKTSLKQSTESTLTQSISSSIPLSSSVSSVIPPNEIVNPVPVLSIHSDDQATILL